MRAQEFIAESNNTAVMAKLADSGKIVRILKKAHSVQFSDQKDWLLIDTDPAKGNRGLGAKWIPANTKFEWVRPYLEKIDESVDAKKIVSYIKKIQGDGHFHMDNLVTRYPSWRLIQIPLSKLTINPDPEKKNPLGTNINVDLDYVQDITPHDIANRPIVVDPSGWIIDGNHRATRAEELGMKSIPAYVPVKQGVAENFADGKGPGRPGDSVRHGIPKHATISELEKASHAKGRKGQLARWQLNMRRGHKK